MSISLYPGLYPVLTYVLTVIPLSALHNLPTILYLYLLSYFLHVLSIVPRPYLSPYILPYCHAYMLISYSPYLRTSNPLLTNCLTCLIYCTPAHTLSYIRTYCHATFPIYSSLAILYLLFLLSTFPISFYYLLLSILLMYVYFYLLFTVLHVYFLIPRPFPVPTCCLTVIPVCSLHTTPYLRTAYNPLLTFSTL
jgi:hypothetical protein